MDRKEIATVVKALDKAANDPPSVTIDLLQRLKKEVVPTEELLRSTKIGLIVNKRRQHSDQTVKNLAGEIVTKWRNEIKGGKSKTSSSSPGGKTANGAAASNGSPDSSNEPKITVPLPERSWKKDGVDIKRTEDDKRDKAIGLIYDALAPNSPDAPIVVIKHACDIERACGSKYGFNSKEYQAKLRSLYQNLRAKSNPGLRKQVLRGDFTAERFVTMSYDELKSAERAAEDQRLQAINMSEAMMPQAERSISSSLECGRCKNRKVSYSQAQTRSADEPMTTFCECTVCGNRWKFS